MGSKPVKVRLAPFNILHKEDGDVFVNYAVFGKYLQVAFFFVKTCLLRSKDIEASSGNGDMAFQEVRKQQSVVEFILNHTDQIFSGESLQIKPKEGTEVKMNGVTRAVCIILVSQKKLRAEILTDV